MPTYDYRCTQGHVFELFHSIKDESRKRCPRCGAAARRVPSGGGGILFKGSGFHATDYRSSDYSRKAKAEKSSGGGDAGGATGGGSGGEKPPRKKE